MKELNGSKDFAIGWVTGYSKGWADRDKEVAVKKTEPKICVLCGNRHDQLHETTCCHPKCPHNME